MTTDEFLDWERKQELRWEFDGHMARAMTGGTEAHAGIEVNVTTALTNRLRGTPCRARGGTLKIRIGSKIRYPDAVVTCTPADLTSDFVPSPVVIFEVLSKSTHRTDKTAKLMEYRSLDTVQHYVLLEQDQVLATMYSRSPTGWAVDQFTAGATLAMPEIGVDLPLDELYADIAFPSEVGSEEA